MNFTKIRRSVWGLFMGCCFLISCHRNTPMLEISQLVKTVEVKSHEGDFSVTYPGVIQAASDVKLAFRVAGPIQRIYVREGEYVKKGTVVARLDPRDYLLQYDAAQARYKQVKEETDRVIELYHKNSVPINEYDKAVAAQKEAWALYQARRNALEDTKLKAPFNGYVQKKYFDDFEIVNQGIPVLTMIDNNYLEVDIDIPATDFIRHGDFVSYYASVDVYPDTLIPLEFVELNQKANFNQLFHARFRLKEKADLRVAPGMSASVTINYTPTDGGLMVIPISALFQEESRSYVWLVDTEEEVIRRNPVEIKQILKDGKVIVISDLQAGDVIVSAGVNHLKEGQKVRVLPPPSSSNVGGLL